MGSSGRKLGHWGSVLLEDIGILVSHLWLYSLVSMRWGPSSITHSLVGLVTTGPKVVQSDCGLKPQTVSTNNLHPFRLLCQEFDHRDRKLTQPDFAE